MSEHCPTCGSPVRVQTSDEGTSCYVPETDALRRERDVLRDWVSRVATSHVVPEFRERAQEVLAEADKAREGRDD